MWCKSKKQQQNWKETKSSLAALHFSPFLEESDVIFRDAYVGTLPTTLPPLQWQEFATFCVEWLPACALPCLFLCKELLDALLPRSIRFFLLFAAYATFVAMQTVILYVYLAYSILRTRSIFLYKCVYKLSSQLCLLIKRILFSHTTNILSWSSNADFIFTIPPSCIPCLTLSILY